MVIATFWLETSSLTCFPSLKPQNQLTFVKLRGWFCKILLIVFGFSSGPIEAFEDFTMGTFLWDRCIAIYGQDQYASKSVSGLNRHLGLLDIVVKILNSLKLKTFTVCRTRVFLFFALYLHFELAKFVSKLRGKLKVVWSYLASSKNLTRLNSVSYTNTHPGDKAINIAIFVAYF